MPDDQGRSLTRSEFDAVIRRAAELSASDPDGEEGALTEGELFRIAGEVGLSNTHVRRALAEVHSGVEGGGALDRIFGPSSVRASRVVPGTPERIAPEIDDFMVASQLLQRVRRSASLLQYRPALDWASQLARAASFTSSKYYVASAKSVEVRLDVVDEGRTLIEIEVDPGTRGDDIAGAVVGGVFSGGAMGSLAGSALAMVTPVGLAIALGVVVGSGVWTGVTYFVGKNHKKKLVEVRTELEGILDSLEVGDSLEPPPPSWRRWVKRHFHGVARDLRGSEEDPDI